VVEVHALPAFCLRVRFVDGTEGVVDASRMILGKNRGVFAPLRDTALFAKAGIEYGAVTWPGEVDLAPDAMYREIKAKGRWVLDE
jgi:hypothetical protein